MFDKLKSVFQEEKKVYQPKDRQACINLFTEQSDELMNHPSFPNKAKHALSSILHQISQIDMMKLNIDNQFKIEKILSKDIPYSVDAYFSIPKAHAVSVVIKEGKTAKDIFIDQFFKFEQDLKDIVQKSIEDQTKKLMEKPKEFIAKKDFYDL